MRRNLMMHKGKTIKMSWNNKNKKASGNVNKMWWRQTKRSYFIINIGIKIKKHKNKKRAEFFAHPNSNLFNPIIKAKENRFWTIRINRNWIWLLQMKTEIKSKNPTKILIWGNKTKNHLVYRAVKGCLKSILLNE